MKNDRLLYGVGVKFSSVYDISFSISDQTGLPFQVVTD